MSYLMNELFVLLNWTYEAKYADFIKMISKSENSVVEEITTVVTAMIKNIKIDWTF